MQMKSVAVHQDLKNAGLLVPFRKGMGTAIFVSHQWVGNAHPDPAFGQMGVLQEALHNILSGSITVESDLLDNLVFNVGAKFTSADVDALGEGYIWYDFFSVPQAGSREYEKHFQAAVDSIPAYVELSNYFIIIAPPLEHADKANTILSYGSWKSRGWCRLERAARALCAANPTMILVENSCHAVIIGAQDYLYDGPGTGAFTVDSDRGRVVAPVMKTLLSNKLDMHLVAREFHNYRFLLSMRGRLLQGCDTSGTSAVSSGLLSKGSEDGNYEDVAGYLEVFLTEYGFSAPCETTTEGWTPIHYAAVAGNVPVIMGLLQKQADVNSNTPKSDADHFLPPGFTPLHLCATCCGKREPMRLLLDHRADANCRSNPARITPLICCAVTSGTEEALEVLLERCAELELQPLFGATALDNAALYGHDKIVQKLIQAGASVMGGDSGLNPLHCAALFSGNADIAQQLVEAACCLEARFRPNPLTLTGMALLAGNIGYRFGRRTSLALISHHSWGSTPLMLAALGKHVEVARVLLQAGADPAASNDHGMKPSSLAALVGLHQNFTEEFSEDAGVFEC